MYQEQKLKKLSIRVSQLALEMYEDQEYLQAVTIKAKKNKAVLDDKVVLEDKAVQEVKVVQEDLVVREDDQASQDNQVKALKEEKEVVQDLEVLEGKVEEEAVDEVEE